MTLSIYLSPHLDDAIYSCGGLIYDQAAAGDRVEIWTIFAGDPPPGPLSDYAAGLHARWQTGPGAVAARRAEDAQACALLGAHPRHFPLPDCIYRRLPDGRPVVASDAGLFQQYHLEEQPLVEQIAAWIRAAPEGSVVAPLSLGGHMDHRLVRAAAQAAGRPLCYYADFPYVLRDPVDLAGWIEPGGQMRPQPVSPAGLAAWQDAVAAYRSQISTFWPDEAAMRAQVAGYRPVVS